METCPIPHVADALDGFVKPRSEVLAIRQNLHANLERNLRLENNRGLSATNLANPPVTQTLPEPPTGITGVRKAYWRALRAHQTAQARYEGLKSELTAFSSDDLGSMRSDISGNSTTGAGLLPLLRLREKQRRLRVLERAVAGIEAEGEGSVDAGLDDLVRERVGDAPVPPVSQRAFGDGVVGRVDVEGRIGELKRVVLAAGANVENGTAVDGRVHVAGHETGLGELFALQQARDELIGWIEKQLALIGDAQAASKSVPPTPGTTERVPGRSINREEIAQLYERYLETRQGLLHTVRSPPQAYPRPDPPLSPGSTRHDKASESADSSASVMLPYVAPLLAAKSEEQSLIQQQAYIRRQLTTAEGETERLARRLADESHLVHPGVSRGRDWALAAADAGETTRNYVEVRVKCGDAAAKDAEKSLEGIVEVPVNLKRLQ